MGCGGRAGRGEGVWRVKTGKECVQSLMWNGFGELKQGRRLESQRGNRRGQQLAFRFKATRTHASI
eukprot:356305-Chlamydomonas_euryale.AAC.4